MAKKALANTQKELDALFANGEASVGFRNLPTGTYQGLIVPESYVIEKKESGGHRAVCQLEVTAAPDDKYIGWKQRKGDDLSTQVGVNIFLGELDKIELGCPRSVAEAAELISETDNLPVEFWVGEAEGEYPPKVRFNGRLAEGSAAPAKAASSDEGELTPAQVRGMSEDELVQLNEDAGLELDPDEYETWEDYAEALIAALDL